MKTPKRERELVLLLNTGLMSERALEKELISLEEILKESESANVFCQTHEIVRRNRITRSSAILKAAMQRSELKAFHFLICVN